MGWVHISLVESLASARGGSFMGPASIYFSDNFMWEMRQPYNILSVIDPYAILLGSSGVG